MGGARCWLVEGDLRGEVGSWVWEVGEEDWWRWDWWRDLRREGRSRIVMGAVVDWGPWVVLGSLLVGGNLKSRLEEEWSLERRV